MPWTRESASQGRRGVLPGHDLLWGVGCIGVVGRACPRGSPVGAQLYGDLARILALCSTGAEQAEALNAVGASGFSFCVG